MDIPSYVLGKKAGGGGGSNYQSKSISITENGTTNITADTGYDALSNVNVTVSGILDTSDADAVSSDMATGKTAYVNGTKITGNVPVGSSSVETNYGSTNVSTYLTDLKVDATQGNQNQMFRSGDKISVYAPLSDVATTVGATAEKIKKDEVICGVTGTYEPSGGSYAPGFVSFRQFTGTDLSYEVENLDTSNMTSFASMFNNCSNLKVKLDLSGWNTSNVTDMQYMFNYCNYLKQPDFTGWDTSSVTNMDYMFSNCSVYNLINFDVSEFDTGNVTSMQGMFQSTGFVSINFTGWDTSKVTTMYMMFYGSSRLTTPLDLSNFNTKKVTSTNQMFRSYPLTTITFGNDFELPLCTNMQNMFQLCNNLDNTTLNNILHICTTATSLAAGNKTLKYIGLSSTQATTCTGLSNWQDCVDAGWSTGY